MKKSLLLAAAVLGVVSAIMSPMGAIGAITGTHEPADKTTAAGSDIDTVDDSEVILNQTMRVSSTSDLILQTTAECSILTSVFNPGSPNAGASSTQGAFGQVEMYITIDGNRVPVSNDDTDGKEGEVVFCNRAYARKIADSENASDGYDQEDDFIRTRTANAFNWMAFDVGKLYDDDGDNVVDIQLHAQYTREPDDCGTRQADDALAPYGKTCADALVGSRTLVIEPVHAATNEVVDPGGQ